MPKPYDEFGEVSHERERLIEAGVECEQIADNLGCTEGDARTAMRGLPSLVDVDVVDGWKPC